MKRIVVMATLGLVLGLVVAALLLERGPGLTPAQALTALTGAVAGGVIAVFRQRRLR